jgi:hypothetical protein
MGPSWDQFAACWSKVGPKLDPSGSQLGDLLAKGDLGQYAKCANYRNCMQFLVACSVRKCTPPAGAVPVNRGLFESNGSVPKLSRLGTFGAGGF